MCWVTYAWSNYILVESWAVSPFKFQWQKVRDEYLGPGFSSMSPQHDSKFWMKNNKNTVISAIFYYLHGLNQWSFQKETSQLICKTMAHFPPLIKPLSYVLIIQDKFICAKSRRTAWFEILLELFSNKWNVMFRTIRYHLHNLKTWKATMEE